MGRHREIACFVVLAVVLSAWSIALAIAESAVESLFPKQNRSALRRATKTLIDTASNDTMINGKTGIRPFVLTGVPAPEYRNIVGISFIKNGREAVCTGTLIDDQLVLTAAHCGCGTSYAVTQEMDMSDGKLIAVRDPPILFDSLICQRSAIRPGYDLALLRLPSEKHADVTTEYKLIPKLAVETINLIRTGTELTVLGYGLTDKRVSGIRMQATVPVFTPDCAMRQYVVAGCAPFVEMILSASARTSGSRISDTCSGDSGGPVFAMTSTKDGPRPELIAVTSRPAPIPHFDLEDHCGGGGIYTVVGRTDIITWLKANGLTAPNIPPM